MEINRDPFLFNLSLPEVVSSKNVPFQCHLARRLRTTKHWARMFRAGRYLETLGYHRIVAADT